MMALISNDASALSTEETRLLAAFRATDDWGRDFVMGVATSQAEDHPRRAPPKLVLVAQRGKKRKE